MGKLDNMAWPFTRLIRKTVDQLVNNSVVLVNDTELLFQGMANSTYLFLFQLYLESSAVADWMGWFTYPAGAAYRAMGVKQSTADAMVALTTYQGEIITVGGSGIGTPRLGLQLIGFIAIGMTAGAITLQWAQDVAEASNTKVLANSLLAVVKMS